MRIRVTSYIDASGLYGYQVDETDPTGLSEQGYRELTMALLSLGFEDVDFTAEESEETVSTERIKKK